MKRKMRAVIMGSDFQLYIARDKSGHAQLVDQLGRHRTNMIIEQMRERAEVAQAQRFSERRVDQALVEGRRGKARLIVEGPAQQAALLFDR